MITSSYPAFLNYAHLNILVQWFCVFFYTFHLKNTLFCKLAECLLLILASHELHFQVWRETPVFLSSRIREKVYFVIMIWSWISFESLYALLDVYLFCCLKTPVPLFLIVPLL
jgi:hypothetical protein